MGNGGHSGAAPSSAAGEPSPEDLLREQRLQRNLKFIVAFLGFLIVAGVAAIIIKIISTATQPAPTPVGAPLSAAPTVAGAASADVQLALPAGARIVSVSTADGRIIVYHDSPSGGGISVLDARNGARLYNILPVPKAD